MKKVILTNGLVKKSQKLPVSEKKLAKKYKNDIPAFVKFIRESDFSVIDDYASSWKFIAKELHSLERFSNLGLCFTPKQEE